MSKVCGTFGLQHKANENVVYFEFNLNECHDLFNMIPLHDGFRRDIQDAIDALEERERFRQEAEQNAPKLRIVLTHMMR